MRSRPTIAPRNIDADEKSTLLVFLQRSFALIFHRCDGSREISFNELLYDMDKPKKLLFFSLDNWIWTKNYETLRRRFHLPDARHEKLQRRSNVFQIAIGSCEDNLAANFVNASMFSPLFPLDAECNRSFLWHLHDRAQRSDDELNLNLQQF